MSCARLGVAGGSTLIGTLWPTSGAVRASSSWAGVSRSTGRRELVRSGRPGIVRTIRIKSMTYAVSASGRRILNPSSWSENQGLALDLCRRGVSEVRGALAGASARCGGGGL